MVQSTCRENVQASELFRDMIKNLDLDRGERVPSKGALTPVYAIYLRHSQWFYSLTAKDFTG